MSSSSIPARLAMLSLALTATSGALAPPALANHGDNATSTLDRDNNQQEVDTYLLSDAGQLACSSGKAALDASEISMSLGGSDIHCFDRNYGDVGWFGQTVCTDRAYTLNRCDQYSVRFNYFYLGTNPTTAERNTWKSVGCHEFGHTASIGHRTAASDPDINSCMRTDNYGPLNFDSHDIDEINADG